MKSSVCAALFTAALFTPLIAQADLGVADSKSSSRELSGVTHKAWCGTKGNRDCDVRIVDGRLKVDDGIGITPSQIKELIYSQKMGQHNSYWHKGTPCPHSGFKHCHSFFEINYISSEGKPRWATIRFANHGAALVLKADIEAWTGKTLRRIGPSIRLDY